MSRGRSELRIFLLTPFLKFSMLYISMVLLKLNIFGNYLKMHILIGFANM